MLSIFSVAHDGVTIIMTFHDMMMIHSGYCLMIRSFFKTFYWVRIGSQRAVNIPLTP